VFLHEAFHGRAQEVLGDKQYARLMKRLEGLKKLAGKKGTVSKFFAEAEAAIPSETPDGDILGEFAAYAVQQYESAPRSLPQSIVTWVKDFIAGIRVGLMRLGWMPENVTEADLAAIARSSVSKFVETNTIGQSKSAMQGQPLFSRKQAEENPQNAPVGNNLGMPEETYPQKWQRWLQDSFNRVKTLQKTIKEKGGTVSPESNVHRAEELSSGKITAGLTDLEKEDMKPLLKQMKKDGITLEELDEFSMARHAPERNRYIASINPDMPDGGSGITTAEAGDILKKYADKRQALEAAAARVYAVNQKTLDRLVEGGHLKQETADEWQGRWKYYVPLKGKAGEEGIQAGRGRGFSVRGSGLLDAMGRGEGNIAESPTAHAFAQAESAIVRTEKTKVGQALVNLIRENPDPDFWTITKRTLKQFEDLYGEPFEGYEKPPEGLVEGVDYHRVKVTTKAERKLAKAEGRKPRTTVAYRPDPSYRNRDDVFSVMVGGQELLITIKDKLVAEQLMKMNSNQLNAVVAGAGQVNRYLAMINTALNPEFVITNLERDFQTAMVNLSGEQSLAM
ncbi:Phage protein, partial [hydrothermal vent metagenome]